MLNEKIEKKLIKKTQKNNPSKSVLTYQTCDPNHETMITQ